VKVNSSIQPNVSGADLKSTEAKKNERIKKTAYEQSAPTEKASLRNDSVKTDLSSKAKDMARARQLAADAPDVREEKIRELKEKIANKQYSVSSADIADRLVDDHMRLAGS